MSRLIAAGLLLFACLAAGAAESRFPFTRTRDCRLTDRAGACAAVVAPDALRPEAEKICAAVRERTGREPAILSDRDPEKLLKTPRNLLILGSRDDNQLTSELYDRYYIILDADYPGAGGWLVRSAPHPDSAAHTLVFAGGSERAGTGRAADFLAAAIRQAPRGDDGLTLPWLWELHPGSNFSAVPVDRAYDAPLWQEVNGYYGNQGYFGWNIISRLLALFYLTGDTAYAQEFVRLSFPDAEALKYLKRTEITGESIELKNRPLSGSYHYLAHLMVVYWNLVADHPFFTPEIRAKVDREFVRQHEYLGDKEANLAITQVNAPMPRVPDRHTVYSALTLYTLCRYLNLYDPRPEWAAGLQSAAYVFDSLSKCFWIYGEYGNYAWQAHTFQGTMDYLMLSGMRRRIPRRHLELLTSQMEVLASGRRRDPFLDFVSMSVFNKLYHLNGKPSALAMRDSNGQNDRVFRLGRSFRPAAAAAGKLPAGQWQRLFIDPAERAAQKPNFANRDAVFAMASLRNGDGDFLLFDGRDERARTPRHIFATLRLALNGVPLLSGYRSQLYSGSDGLIAPESRQYAELRKMDLVGDTALFSARVNDSNFINQTRTWLKRTGRYALALDVIEPERAASSLLLNFSWELAAGVRIDGLRPGCGDLTAAADDAGRRIDKSALTLSPADRILKRRPTAPDMLAARKPGEALDAAFVLDRPFRGYLLPELLRSSNSALVEVALDGRKMTAPLNRTAQEYSAEPFWIGPVELTAGRHTLSMISAGEAVRGNGQMLGIAGLRLIPAEQARAYRVGFSVPVRFRNKKAIDDTFNGGFGNLLEVRHTVPAAAGDRLNFFTLLAPAGGASGNCAALSPNAAALRLPEPAVAVTGSAERMQADLAVLAGSHLAGSGVLRIRSLVAADRPVDLDWDFQSGRLNVRCFAPTELVLAGSDEPLKFARGLHALDRPLPDAARRELTDYLSERTAVLDRPAAASTDSGAKAKLPATELAAVWRQPVSEFPTAQQVFSFRGKPALLTAVDRKVAILDLATGRELLGWTEESPVTALHVSPELDRIFIGRMDCQVNAYDMDGRRSWTFRSEMHPDVAATGKAYWYRTAPGLGGIRAIADGPFKQDRRELFIGTACTVEILHADGTLDQRLRQWWGPCSQLTLIRRAGGENVMLVGRRHTCFHHLGVLEASNPKFPCHGYWDLANPKHFVLAWTGVIRGHIFFEDLTGDGKPVVISDLTGVDNRIAIWDADGKPVRDVPLFGANDAPMRATAKPASAPMPVRDTAVAALKGGKVKHIYTVTEDALLLEFNPQLQLRRCTALPVDPLLLVAFPGEDRLLVAGRDGDVVLLDGGGRPLAAARVAGTPLWGSREGRLAVIATDREIAAFSIVPAAAAQK